MATPTTTTMAPDPPQTTAPQMQPPLRQLDSSAQVVDAQSGCLPIELDRLSHSYGERLALDHLTFNVGAAEIFGLLGPNGSGKTTLFRILSTLMVPTGGSAKILAFDAAREPNRVRQQIGVVFQARSLDLKLTARENLIHQGHLYGLTGKQLGLRVSEILERVGLLDRAHDLVETLSGGMQRRVELAKGLIHRPRVLLLDEPTTGLDPGARIDIWQYLRMLRNDEGLAILVTTHLMEEAEHCDRLAILNEGSVVALGRPADLKAGFGGEVISLDAQDEASARSLATNVALKLGVHPTIMGRTVRVELPHGQRFLVEVLELFSEQILSVTIAKPSLEDVFIRSTGHRFWSESQEPAAATKLKKARH